MQLLHSFVEPSSMTNQLVSRRPAFECNRCLSIAALPLPAFSQRERIRSCATGPTGHSFRIRGDAYDCVVKAEVVRIDAAASAYSFAYSNPIFLLPAPFVAAYVFDKPAAS